MMTYPFGSTLAVYEGPFGYFYKIGHFGKWYVMETAENEKDARAYIFEDSDLFNDDLTAEELYEQLRKWIEKFAFEESFYIG